MGVGKDFTKFDITKRMRLLAKDLHPDNGGDEEKFKEMMEAYTLLTNPEKRERFDATGERSREIPFLSKFREMVGSIFLEIAQKVDNPNKVDLIKIFRDTMRENIRATEKSIRMANKEVGKLEQVKKRINKKGEGDNILAQAVQSQVDDIERKVAKAKEGLDFLNKSKDLLDEYNYDWDKIEEIQTGFSTGDSIFTISGMR